MYHIAQGADTVIVLRHATKDFAVWEEPDGPKQRATPAEQNESDAEKTICSGVGALNVESITTETPSSDDDDNVEPSTPTSSAAATEYGDDTTKFRIAVYENLSITLPTDASYYLVSSEHLKSACPALVPSFTKDIWIAGKGEDAGRYYVILEDCDEEALDTLLQIIHLEDRRIPRVADLEKLAKLASLIDRFGCQEEVDVFVDCWIFGVLSREPVPTEYCRKLVLWLYVAWVLKDPDIFRAATATAIVLGVDGCMRTMGLPIPTEISGEFQVPVNSFSQY